MRFDRFFDTIDKRRCAFFILVASMFLLAAMQTLILGSAMIQIRNYDQLFDILKTDILSISYISRCIYSMISQASMTPFEGFLILVRSLRFFEVSLCLILFVFICSHFPKVSYKRYIWMSLIVFLIVGIGCVICVVSGLQANSLLDVIQQLNWIGILFMIQGSFQIICCLVGIYQCVIQDYVPAMRTEVLYIEDEK